MGFRVRHIPTGRFVKNIGHMWYTIEMVNTGKHESIVEVTTRGCGHIYTTRKGAKELVARFKPEIRREFEIVQEVIDPSLTTWSSL